MVYFFSCPTFSYKNTYFAFTFLPRTKIEIYTLCYTLVVLKHVKTFDWRKQNKASCMLLCLIFSQQASPTTGIAQTTAAPINLTMMFQNLLFLAYCSGEVLRAWQVFAALLSSMKYLYSMYLKAILSKSPPLRHHARTRQRSLWHCFFAASFVSSRRKSGDVFRRMQVRRE